MNAPAVKSPPVVHAIDLAALVAYYRDVLGFAIPQAVPGVFALATLGPVRLQVWQRAGLHPRVCRIELESGTGSIFEAHARLARVARSAMVEAGPELEAWGVWQFSMCDPQGNRLVFFERLLPRDPAAGTGVAGSRRSANP